ncbi:DNA-directed RNA polymerase I subunit RPA2 isoform X1 [Diorhabda sublineata]|uniref:DNA-directed RNA polymerase I subunit RPA2 isoform X1 n=2 Tax=Diorhabda sublineata TaxID=1163346 RepID=UPI0024E17E1C|nr:DNA-directed RNA polymerase I subunit RPA2 isoform X1 [Diorhabda sublineata]XP_056631028.1 DNA-directed RNA polymerase I subunit RPA2 isoform X1 [Diorhabda sublineata]XP_056631029.1 DNA-directed RNA polymerase I subunit RPA2 isoform X1 [Diorhabda sublineata]XP_056631030.1 DNA-directed RNA polymerase I subunit RPA2 isoform X1 [Diorhabda sublineata]
MENPSLKYITNPYFGNPPEKQNTILQSNGEPHITSFNYMVNEGLADAINDLNAVEFKLDDRKIKLAISNYSFQKPQVPPEMVLVKNKTIYPTTCRQSSNTYKGKLFVDVDWFIDGEQQQSFTKDLGEIPVMVKSDRCNLNKMSPKELVKHGEHEQEWGGYFIIKGNEKLVRMLLMTRRNYPIAIRRSGWKQRGALFSESGVSIRCVRKDQTATNNVLHFVNDGTAKLMFSYQKVLYYSPLCLILKALCNYSDQHIFQRLIQGCEDDTYYVDCVKNMLRAIHKENLHNKEDCRSYIGNMFRVKFRECPEWSTDQEIADFIFKKCILIHLDTNEDKFNMLVFMTQKLFSFAQDKCKIEGADAVMMQELLLGGHLYLQIIKEKLYSWLNILKLSIIKLAKSTNFSLSQTEILKAARYSGGIEAAMSNFLATGNLNSISGLGLMQDKGLVIMAENINRMRYMSHFRAVHRGAFFQEMRTTEARQLLPDAWGFICPVHTPDGAPCGLLNHLTLNCIITNVPDPVKVKNIPLVLTELGMKPPKYADTTDLKTSYVVQLDGRIIGYVDGNDAAKLIQRLRLFKIKGVIIPETLEIAFVPLKKTVAQYPGIFLFTGPARMMRPLMNLYTNKIELVGTFEQVYMDICVTPEEAYKKVTTHMELSKTGFLSNLAQLIPMPDCNQSPRNMYQCQMGKQTMGSPCHTWDLQSETKLYRLQTPGSPLFRPVHYDNIQLDDFAMGTNAIVAVISYTGYDMEDAMIINKASEERGLCHGSIYKSEFVTLDHAGSFFERDPDSKDTSLAKFIDSDGLPFIGRILKESEPLYSYFDADRSVYIVKVFRGKEECYMHSVKLCANFDQKNSRKTVCFTYRVPRNPSVGDKFASRAGQKGICSQKWPTEDLPFTETGLVPDIVFNPHGFPSRMTIAMMIEIMAGKSAALHGLVHDATPFIFTEEDTAIDYFGKLLEKGGYNYYGTETMYSGIDGREMTAQIFFGIVHYQRLRHMVSDKWQVRSTGPINILTRQPLKGRKRGGGVRFGEMERDALISHGASFLLQDRLFHCSDETTAFICTSCGTLLGPITAIMRLSDKPQHTETKETCRLCDTDEYINKIKIPYIFKFFITQLASCNINVRLGCQEV